MQIFTNISINNAISLLSDSFLINYFKFDKILPMGRLNGFENMLKLIKYQLSYQLSIHNNNNNNVNDKNFSDNNTTKTTANSNNDIKSSEPYQIDNRINEVAVLLSGGVDSSVALQLLINQGYLVRAYYLKIWLEDEIAHLNECPWEEDLTYAQSVCDMLNVTLG